MEVWFKYRLQNIQQSLLHHAIADCRYAEQALSAVRFRYCNPANGEWLLALLLQLRQKFGQIGVKGFGKVFNGLAVYTGSSIRRLHLDKCQSQRAAIQHSPI